MSLVVAKTVRLRIGAGVAKPGTTFLFLEQLLNIASLPHGFGLVKPHDYQVISPLALANSWQMVDIRPSYWPSTWPSWSEHG